MRALIIVDVQRDFATGGALQVGQDPERIFPRVNHVAREGGYQLVVLTQDWHPADHQSFAEMWGKKPGAVQQMSYGPQILWPRHCVQGTEGARLHPALDVPTAQLIVRKGCHAAADSYGAFADANGVQTGLEAFMRQRRVDSVDVCGWALDFCVAATAIQARKAGLQARVLRDICAAVDHEDSLVLSIAEMQRTGVQIT